MATRVFTDAELERLRSFPEINPDGLIRFFTLAKPHVEFVDPGRGRGPADRLGMAVQLCTLPWLGFVPDDVTCAPPAAVARLSQHLGIPMGELRGYAAREQTRTTHLGQVVRYLKWTVPDERTYKELDEFLLARAVEHDSPSLLFRLAREHRASSMVVRPGPVLLLEHVATARAAAKRETYDRYSHLLTGTRPAELDGLLVFDPAVKMTRPRWLTTPPVSDTPDAIKAEIGKLGFLRGLDAHTLDPSSVPAERRRHLTTVARRLTGQALERREPQRRYPVLLTRIAQSGRCPRQDEPGRGVGLEVLDVRFGRRGPVLAQILDRSQCQPASPRLHADGGSIDRSENASENLIPHQNSSQPPERVTSTRSQAGAVITELPRRQRTHGMSHRHTTPLHKPH